MIIIALVLIIGSAVLLISQTGSQQLPQTYCTLESRTVDGCTAQYDPVCGWFDSNRVQCMDYPCAITAGNACEACRNPDVEYWTPGICPNS